MIKLQRLDSLEPIREMKEAYLRELVFPIDAYWQSAVVDRAPHCLVTVNDTPAGYLAASSDKRLLQFHVAEPFLPLASGLFSFVIEGDLVRTAAAGTFEPAYLAHCLDHQNGITVRSYLFQDHKRVDPVLAGFPYAQFKPATPGDARDLATFFSQNNEFEDTDAISNCFGDHLNYARSLIEAGQAFLLVNEDDLLGVGECRVSASQPPYADLGMITSRDHRRQGIGTYILASLKEYCYGCGLKPICSCAAENHPSRKTIEKAGFITRHRLLDIQFAA
jgi:predicted acetyltransferase